MTTCPSDWEAGKARSCGSGPFFVFTARLVDVRFRGPGSPSYAGTMSNEDKAMRKNRLTPQPVAGAPGDLSGLTDHDPTAEEQPLPEGD